MILSVISKSQNNQEKCFKKPQTNTTEQKEYKRKNK
jgi:hypothetical protein